MASFDPLIPKITNERELADFRIKFKDAFPDDVSEVRLCGSGADIPLESDDHNCIRIYPIYVALGLKFPLDCFIRNFFRHYNLALTQLSPSGYTILLGFLALKRNSGLDLGFNVFRELYIVKHRKDNVYDITPRYAHKILIPDVPTSDQGGWNSDLIELRMKPEEQPCSFPRFRGVLYDSSNDPPTVGTFDASMISSALQLKEKDRNWLLLLDVIRRNFFIHPSGSSPYSPSSSSYTPSSSGYSPLSSHCSSSSSGYSTPSSPSSSGYSPQSSPSSSGYSPRPSPGYAPQSSPSSSAYSPSSSVHSPTSPSYLLSSPPYCPAYSPSSSVHSPTSPNYRLSSPPYCPSYSPSSSVHSPTSPSYSLSSPPYSPTSPSYRISSPPYCPAYSPSCSVHSPTSPSYSLSSPPYSPTSPSYRLSSPPYCPAYSPSSSVHSPTSPSYRLSSPPYCPAYSPFASSLSKETQAGVPNPSSERRRKRSRFGESIIERDELRPESRDPIEPSGKHTAPNLKHDFGQFTHLMAQLDDIILSVSSGCSELQSRCDGLMNELETVKQSDCLTKQELEQTKKKLKRTEFQKEVCEEVIKKLTRESVEKMTREKNNANNFELLLQARNENDKLILENQKLSMELGAMKREKEEIERRVINEAGAYSSGQADYYSGLARDYYAKYYSRPAREIEINPYAQEYRDCIREAGNPSIVVDGKLQREGQPEANS